VMLSLTKEFPKFSQIHTVAGWSQGSMTAFLRSAP
ncbi:unnamed protein product, partial [Rotaria socialis]